eukprot:TRINITY_DN2872_c0_g1_i4.p2 TRINITY_DN2872_c0_g1~~TRINITY_DN2872_c0_g1_i4.p2  ORF type:complete len:109 (-),score=14.80 TRINITY_DN2872_c0_g1_i4:116-442(-)
MLPELVHTQGKPPEMIDSVETARFFLNLFPLIPADGHGLPSEALDAPHVLLHILLLAFTYEDSRVAWLAEAAEAQLLAPFYQVFALLQGLDVMKPALATPPLGTVESP